MTAPTPPASRRAALLAQGLTKSYGRTRALDGVDLAIHEGESVAVMGPSGSGKTTLLHCLSGIIAADAGSVRIELDQGPLRVESLDAEGRARLRREQLGFVFQQGMLVPELTAVENVALPLLLNGVDRVEAERHAARWLAAMGLGGLEARRIGQLSGGQAQRVAIARAQSTDPVVVFADEPTGALDSATASDVMSALLATTTGRRRTLVVVTHDPRVAARCSRTIHLVDGRITHDSSTTDSPTTEVTR